MQPIALGLDFGTESVRALLVDATGTERGVGTDNYRHGQILETLPGRSEKLPSRYALQHPQDWLESAAKATRRAVEGADIDLHAIVGVGVDFTSCTMLPTLIDGTPLCQLPRWHDVPQAWAKLWKHHGAVDQTEKINQLARQRGEPFLDRYGGTIGLEWFFPKLLETIETSPDVAGAAEIWLEAGDWFVWQLVQGRADSLPRSTCQAGYKAMWSPAEGYANQDFLRAVDPRLADAAATKMPGRMLSPGEQAGSLNKTIADQFGIPAGIAVSAATIDAHAAVPGVGAGSAGTLVMVLGTSSCHMLNAATGNPVQGVAGMVEGGILPGLFGYETGQAAVGDAFAWLLNLLNLDSFDALSEEAKRLSPGADGLVCLDWMNGCRTPLMDGRLKGAFTGLTLEHGPAHLYRALLEGSACGLRWIVEVLRDGGVPVDHLIATGGLPHHNPDIVQVYANVLQSSIEIHPSSQGSAVGAAVLGMVAAGQDKSGFASIADAAEAMAAVPDSKKTRVTPAPETAAVYDALYASYRATANALQA